MCEAFEETRLKLHFITSKLLQFEFIEDMFNHSKMKFANSDSAIVFTFHVNRNLLFN